MAKATNDADAKTKHTSSKEPAVSFPAQCDRNHGPPPTLAQDNQEMTMATNKPAVYGRRTGW